MASDKCGLCGHKAVVTDSYGSKCAKCWVEWNKGNKKESRNADTRTRARH